MPDDPCHLLPRACRLIEAGMDQGLHLGMQVYISREFVPLADFALGWNSEGDPLNADRILPWLSAGKPLTALAILQLVDSRKLHLDDAVAQHIPEFGAAGKEQVLLRHLLTHTAGLKPIATGWPHLDWDTILQKICAAPLRHGATAGSHVGYDPARSWFVLGEIVRQVDGRPIEQYVREEIFLPLGMENSWMSLPEDVFHAHGERLGMTYTTADDRIVPTKSHLWENCRSPSPGGSVRGPIRELGRFYEMLLRSGSAPDGRQLLSATVVDDMLQRHRQGLYDETFQHTVDFGWGVIINSNRYGAETVPYGFGRYAGETAAGHGGSQSAIGFVDPQHQFVVTAVANGMPGEAPHNERFREILSAIYLDLELVRTP